MLLQKKPVETKRVGATLVAAYHKANPPLIWRFDLERNHSFTLALQGDEGDWELGVTSPKGEFYAIARFLAREDAEEAFGQTHKVLLRKRLRWLRWTLGITAVVVLVIFMGLYGLGRFVGAGNRLPTFSSPSSAPTMNMENGIPLPADQVLRPPSN
ncbi:MAG: hypothetical protein SFW62_02330 [Alphaproteobacteria bacterium]|nr:hypothetical protein [Alphaproteobacteria bacterium]